jgi:hypothetical protein
MNRSERRAERRPARRPAAPAAPPPSRLRRRLPALLTLLAGVAVVVSAYAAMLPPKAPPGYYTPLSEQVAKAVGVDFLYTDLVPEGSEPMTSAEIADAAARLSSPPVAPSAYSLIRVEDARDDAGKGAIGKRLTVAVLNATPGNAFTLAAGTRWIRVAALFTENAIPVAVIGITRDPAAPTPTPAP